MSDLQREKAVLRRAMRERLQDLSTQNIAQAGEQIACRILAMQEVRASASVFCYISMSGEIATHALIEQLLNQGKRVSVPVIAGGELEAHRIRSLSDCRSGAYGILEPASPCPETQPIDVSLTPGLAFCPDGRRLGKGKGFYDRFLARHPSTLAIALALEEQVLDHVPAGPGDTPVAWIITPVRNIRCAEG